MNFFMPFTMNFYRPFVNYVPQQRLFTIAPLQNYYNPESAYSIFMRNINHSENVTPIERTVKTPASTPKPPKTEKPYNKVNGEKLAQTVLQNLPNDRDPEDPMCAKYVQNAVEKCGLGEYVKGNAEYCKNIFRANPNFKEIKSKDFSKLPAGSVVVYDAFDKVTFKNGKTGTVGENGHVLIALGDGRGCSDIVEDEIVYSSKAYTFIPV